MLYPIEDDLVDVVVCDFTRVCTVALPADDRLHDKVRRIGGLVGCRINNLADNLALLV